MDLLNNLQDKTMLVLCVNCRQTEMSGSVTEWQIMFSVFDLYYLLVIWMTCFDLMFNLNIGEPKKGHYSRI